MLSENAKIVIRGFPDQFGNGLHPGLSMNPLHLRDRINVTDWPAAIQELLDGGFVKDMNTSVVLTQKGFDFIRNS